MSLDVCVRPPQPRLLQNIHFRTSSAWEAAWPTGGFNEHFEQLKGIGMLPPPHGTYVPPAAGLAHACLQGEDCTIRK